MSGRGESKTSPRRVTAAERALRAVELRKAGMSYEQIATQPISATDKRQLYPGKDGRKRAFDAVNGHLMQLARDTRGRVEELRALEIARLDDMEVAITPSTRPARAVRCPEEGCRGVMWREPDVAAVNARLRLGERRSKLEGLDATDVNDARMVELLEEQVALTHRGLVTAMDRAGVPDTMQREVLSHFADALREAEEAAEDEG